MEFTCLIQKNAMQSYQTILSLPDNAVIDPKFLVDLSEDEFRCALDEIYYLFRNFYKRMADDPDSYGMIRYSLEDNEAGCKKNAQQFNKLQHVLELIFSSVNNSKTSLDVDYTQLKNLKARKLPYILERLKEMGFEISQSNNILKFTHENNNIFVIFAICGIKCLNWTFFTSDTKTHTTCIDFIYASIFSEENRQVFLDMHSYLLQKDFTFKLKLNSNTRYTKKGKLDFFVQKNDLRNGFYIKMRLANIHKYIHLLDAVTSNVRENILNGYDCIGCNDCKIRYKFTYQEKKYVKCSLGNFYIYDPKPEDVPSIKCLLEAELPYYCNSQ